MELHKDQFLTRALAEASTPIFMIDRSSRIVWANGSYCSVMGVLPETVSGSTPPSFLALSKDRDGHKNFWQMLFRGENWIGEMMAVMDGNRAVHFQTVVTPLPDRRGNPAYFLVIQYDITKQKEETDRMWHVAHHDGLTGLANRTLFSNLLEHTIHQVRRMGSSFAVMFIDLDKFKPVNDTYGHHVGDLLLRHAGEILKKNVRESDVVARFGGDEFGIILTQVGRDINAQDVAGGLREAQYQSIGKIAENIVFDLCTPVVLDGCEIKFGGSVGVSVYPDHGVTVEDLLKSADAAMYAAKEAGRNTFRFHQG